MNVAIDNLTKAAMDLLDKNWERCDKETGSECRGLTCDFVEHRVMLILEEISKENNS
jgi:hypothetical protein